MAGVFRCFNLNKQEQQFPVTLHAVNFTECPFQGRSRFAQAFFSTRNSPLFAPIFPILFFIKQMMK